MKMPLDWHKKCLENSRHNLELSENTLARMQADVCRHRVSVARYAEQIAEAERRGVDAFDSEKFGKKHAA